MTLLQSVFHGAKNTYTKVVGEGCSEEDDIYFANFIPCIGGNTGKLPIKLELVLSHSKNSEVGMLDSSHRSPCKPNESSHAIHSGSWATTLGTSGVIGPTGSR